MDAQQRVAEFVATNEMDAPPAFRLLDLAAEVGELAADANESSGYGATPSAVTVERDEIGDALFALLALAASLDVDAEEALDDALAKYESRLRERGEMSSGQ